MDSSRSWWHDPNCIRIGKADYCPRAVTLEEYRHTLIISHVMMNPNKSLLACFLTLLCHQVHASDFRITDFTGSGQITWSNAFPIGICTVETAQTLTEGAPGPWLPERNYFTTNSVGQAVASSGPSNQFVRLLAVDLSTNNPSSYADLTHSYGRISTIAGTGVGGIDNVNYWQPAFEGGYATNAALSRPHYAMADEVGNIFIVDKGSHSVLKVTLDGRIHTVAGTHTGGFNGDGPAAANSLHLFQPNGLYVHGDGTFFVMDTGNGRVRRVDTNGVMTTLFTVPGGISVGRGLWVDEEELDVLFCDGTAFKAWNSTNGVTVLNTNFTDLGNLEVTSKENAIVTDRGANKVYKVDTHGKNIGQRTLLYGNGKSNPVVDGTSAVTNSLSGGRGIWKFPADGYLLALHEGSQILYVDTLDIVHVFVDGQNDAHAGDGRWFYAPGAKVAQARSVTMDSQGNILIVENDFGYVRRIDFRRLTP